MCLAEIAANYTTCSGQELQKTRLMHCQQLRIKQAENVKASSSKMALDTCTREAIIRFHRFNQEKEPSKVYRSKIMLYVPWRDESSDLLGDFRSHYEDNRPVASLKV